LIREVARLFGWGRLGSEIATALDADVAEMLTLGMLTRTSTGLVAGVRA
jgi:hypothetical protein